MSARKKAEESVESSELRRRTPARGGASRRVTSQWAASGAFGCSKGPLLTAAPNCERPPHSPPDSSATPPAGRPRECPPSLPLVGSRLQVGEMAPVGEEGGRRPPHWTSPSIRWVGAGWRSRWGLLSRLPTRLPGAHLPHTPLLVSPPDRHTNRIERPVRVAAEERAGENEGDPPAHLSVDHSLLNVPVFLVCVRPAL